MSIGLFKKKPPKTAAITRFEVESEAYQAYLMLGKEAAAGRIPIVHMALVSKDVSVRTVDVFDRRKSQMEDQWAYAPLGVDRKRMADDRAIGYQMTVRDCHRFVSDSGMHVIAILEETDPSQYDRFVGRWDSETRRYPVVEKRPVPHAHVRHRSRACVPEVACQRPIMQRRSISMSPDLS